MHIDLSVVVASIGVFVASAALFVNGLNTYFQHFHKSRRLFVSIKHCYGTKFYSGSENNQGLEQTLQVVITNGGNVPIVLRGVELRGGKWKDVDGFGFEDIDEEYTPSPDCFTYSYLETEEFEPHNLHPGEHLILKFDLLSIHWREVENWGYRGNFCEATDEFQLENGVYL